MTTPSSPLSAENALALLRQAVDQDPDRFVQERIAMRLEHSIAAGLVPIAASVATSGPMSAAATNHAATAATNHAATAVPGTAFGSLAASSKLMLGLTLVAGMGIGVGADRWAMTLTSRSPTVTRTVPGSPQPVTTAAITSTDSVSPTDTMPTVRAEDLPRLPAASQKRLPAELAPGQVSAANYAESDSNSAPTDPRDDSANPDPASLRDQQALLDQARLALGKGEPERCLAAIATHRNRFPQSLLAEERDALTIKALVASRSRSAARERLVAFLENYPRSLLIPSLEATVGRIP